MSGLLRPCAASWTTDCSVGVRLSQPVDGRRQKMGAIDPVSFTTLRVLSGAAL